MPFNSPIFTAPTFAICKKAIKILTLEQYVETGVLSRRHAEVIKDTVRKHRNILVVGGTGSGKNYPDERIFILWRIPVRFNALPRI